MAFWHAKNKAPSATNSRREQKWQGHIECLEDRLVLDATVVFNELFYNPADGSGASEWLELYNQQSVDVDISDWKLTGGVEYQFPEGTVVEADSYLVVAADPSSISNSIGPFTGSLSDGGEELRLVNNSDRIMSLVDYDDSGDWPVAADGSGASLAKLDKWSGTEEAANWSASLANGGTPGATNFTTVLSNQGTVLLDDSFETAASSSPLDTGLPGDTGFWAGPWSARAVTDGAGIWRVEPGGLGGSPGNRVDYERTDSGRVTEVASRGFSSDILSATPHYFSFRFRQDAAVGTDAIDNSFATTWHIGPTGRLRVGFEGGTLFVETQKTGSPDIHRTFSSIQVADGSTNDIVIKLEQDAGGGGSFPGDAELVSVYVNPGASEPAVPDFIQDDGASIAFFDGQEFSGVDLEANYANGQTASIDNLRIGTSYAQVAPINPIAAVIGTEPFDAYAPGATLNGQEGGGGDPTWTARSVFDGQGVWTTEAPGLGGTALGVEYVRTAASRNPETASRSILSTTPSTTTHYFGFLFEHDAAQGTDSSNNVFETEWTFDHGRGVRVGVEGTNLFIETFGGVSTHRTVDTQNLIQAGTTHQIVVKVEQDAGGAGGFPGTADLISVFVDPVSTEPAMADFIQDDGVSFLSGAGQLLDALDLTADYAFSQVAAIDQIKAATGFSEALAVTTPPPPVPERPPIRINEIAPSTDPNFWLELINTGDTAVELGGYVITVDGVTSSDYVLPAQLLAPGAMTVISEAQLQFDAEDGDKVYVYTSGKLGVVDGQQVSDRLQGLSDEYDGWWFPDSATQGAANSFQFHDEIVINEIMYHHQASNTTSGGYVEDDEQWVELYNRGAQTIDLMGWEFGDGIGFSFDTSTLLAPGDYAVIADDPVALAAEFPAIASKIVGNFTGSLSNGGERITLLDDFGNPADQVRYYDGGHWHEEADGDGSSLELRDPDSDNSVALAWAPSDESSTSAWQTYSYTMTAEAPLHGTAVNFQEFRLGLLNSGVFLIDDIQVIQRPGIDNLDLMQNGDFESGDAAWRFVGTHGGSQVIVDPDNASNNVLRVEVTGARHYVNDVIESTLANGASVVNGWEYEISYRAKWISGSNQVNTELFHGRVAKTTLIDVPENTGTPGAQNSQFVANAGPTYADFAHGPVIPDANEAITVSTYISDPDGVNSATLWYRPDGGSWTSLAMSVGSDGKYFANIPGQSAGTIVQFYVESTDTLGATSEFPALGENSRALIKVQDGQANSSRQNIRVIMLDSDADELYAHENIISDKRFGATVIYNESEVYYDTGVRLRGSHFTRNSKSSTGYNIRFQPDQLFRGVHETIGIKKRTQTEILPMHIINAASDVPGHYDDIVHFIGPDGSGAGTATLKGARYTDVFLDSQFPNGGDGTIYSLKKIRDITQTVDGSAASNPESLKLGWPIGSGAAIDIDYRGTDKEQYRWQFELRSARGRDDYSKLIELADILQLNGAALQAAAPDVIDVDQFMRVLATASLLQPWDFYTAGVGTKNFMFYAPEDGGPMLALPWDWDSSFSNNNGGATAPLFGGGLLSKITALPVYTRLLHGHLLDIINTTYNATYMSDWASHYGSVQGTNYSSQLNFITNRAAFVLGQLPAQVPFAITTNGGNSFSTNSDSVTLTGNGWIDVREIRLDGQLNPLSVTWLDADTWEVTVPLTFGTNNLLLEAYDHQGALVGTDSIEVTSTFDGPESPLDVLRISEINYNPADPSVAENAAGFTDKDLFEFIELVNIGSTTISLSDVQFERINGGSEGVSFDFSNAAITSLDPNERVVIVEDLAAFEARYGTGLPVAGEWSGGLSNNSETLTVTVNGTTLHQFAYDDDWYPSTDNGGNTLQIVDATNPDLGIWGQQAGWQASSQVGGSPGSDDTPPLPGDYNSDGTVDSGDYDLWKSTFGSTTDLRADGNSNNVIDAFDYAVWRENLGQAAPVSVVAASRTSTPTLASTESTVLAASWPLPLVSDVSSRVGATDLALASFDDNTPPTVQLTATLPLTAAVRDTIERSTANDLAIRDIVEAGDSLDLSTIKAKRFFDSVAEELELKNN